MNMHGDPELLKNMSDYLLVRRYASQDDTDVGKMQQLLPRQTADFARDGFHLGARVGRLEHGHSFGLFFVAGRFLRENMALEMLKRRVLRTVIYDKFFLYLAKTDGQQERT